MLPAYDFNKDVDGWSGVNCVKWAGGEVQVVECLLSKHEAPTSCTAPPKNTCIK
jgi:hypothetical protein